MAELTIHQKLINIQNQLHVPKNQFNKFGNYSYRSCEDILEAISELRPPPVIVWPVIGHVYFIHLF